MTRMYLPHEAASAGINITWRRNKQCLEIGGWYDNVVGIAPINLTLREFFELAGITEKDCQKAWQEIAK